jgi:hypothetical protein
VRMQRITRKLYSHCQPYVVLCVRCCIWCFGTHHSATDLWRTPLTSAPGCHRCRSVCEEIYLASQDVCRSCTTTTRPLGKENSSLCDTGQTGASTRPAAEIVRKNSKSAVRIYNVRMFGNLYLYHYRHFFRRRRNRPWGRRLMTTGRTPLSSQKAPQKWQTVDSTQTKIWGLET